MTLTDQTWSCAAAETRTVWDGDHIAEVRWPWGSQQDTGPMEEAETMHPRQMGRVLYTQGLNLDKPLLLARIDYDSFFPGTNAIIPHTNWLGHYDSGTFVTQGNATGPACMKRARLGQDATKYPFEDPDVTGGLNQDSITICYDVEWPAPYLWNSKRPIDRGKYGPPSWMGSLVEGGRDASGQMYMRNRYYDPSTGRFTQEDPIGLAGGINLYGFANGDAVNFYDPYGLDGCEFGKDCWAAFKKWFVDAWTGEAAGTGPPTAREVFHGAFVDLPLLSGAAKTAGLARGGAAAASRLRAFEFDAQSSFTRNFETQRGAYGVMVEGRTEGRHLIVEEVAVYPNGADLSLPMTRSELAAGLRAIQQEAADRGYESVTLRFHRTKNGHVVQRTVRLRGENQ
jgi:RHS repeat-associated protein